MTFVNNFSVVEFYELPEIERRHALLSRVLAPTEWTVYKARVQWHNSPDRFHDHCVLLLPVSHELLKVMGNRWEFEAKRVIDQKLTEMIGKLK